MQFIGTRKIQALLVVDQDKSKQSRLALQPDEKLGGVLGGIGQNRRPINRTAPSSSVLMPDVIVWMPFHTSALRIEKTDRRYPLETAEFSSVTGRMPLPRS